MFDLHRQSRLGGQGFVKAAARLNAGFLVGGDDEFIVTKGLSCPDAFIEVQDTPGLERKVGIARENPGAVLPRPDGITVEPTPHGAVTDGGDKT